MPLIYGYHHSWNLAWLDGAHSDIPYHLHREGVEIHLGYPLLHGDTVLGDSKAELTEGCAMPAPPNTRHGYTNIGSKTHYVPFIFGAFTCGGWGIFLHVEPQSCELGQLNTLSLLSLKLNGTVSMEQEIARISERSWSTRYPIFPAEETDRDGVCGLEVPVALVTAKGIEVCPVHYRIFAVVGGRGTLDTAG